MLIVILGAVLCGVILTLMVQAYLLRTFFLHIPVTKPPFKPQSAGFSLPKELQDILKSSTSEVGTETCLALNLLIQFLFQELKDTNKTRRWVTEKLNIEFAELLTQTTTGKLLDNISVRDFSLGDAFPIIKGGTIKPCHSNDNYKTLEEVNIEVEIDYDGGFQIGVDVDLVFGKTAFLSVKVKKLQGTARLQFTRQPFSHWSFSFYQEPLLELDVESQFEGRPLPQITSLIVNQIRRTVRKKHTLPNYKIRYKPFFLPQEPNLTVREINLHGNSISLGQLDVTITECSRLQQIIPDSKMYCTLAVDKLPWIEMMSSKRKLWVTHDIEIVRAQSPSIGIIFKDEFVLDRYEEMVVVETVHPNSPAYMADIRKSDVLIAVNGTRISSLKQAAKSIKQAGDKLSVRIERCSRISNIPNNSSAPNVEMRGLEDSVSYKDNFDGGPEYGDDEEYININMKHVQDDESTAVAAVATTTAPTGDQTSTKKFPFLPSKPQLFQRKRSRTTTDQDSRGSPQGSPVLKSHIPPEGSESLKSGLGARPRAKSDTRLDIKKENDDSSSTEFENEAMIVDSAGGDARQIEEQSYSRFNLLKTRMVPSIVCPVWDQKFDLQIEADDKFCNICVWCKVPEKLDKHDRVIKPEKDILLGHVSVSVADIALECAATLQGDCQLTYKLSPPDIKAGASRGKIHPLAVHRGFDSSLCHGDITLYFRHVPSGLSLDDRKQLQKMTPQLQPDDAESGLVSLDTEPDLLKQGESEEEDRHVFISTNFQSTTQCNFCSKKIWLKAAFQCKTCQMICHKKCREKCQAQTLCSKDGFSYKAGFKPTISTDEPDNESTKSQNISKTIQPVKLFNKLRRRDSPHRDNNQSSVSKLKERKSSTSSSESSSGRKRNNSAPEVKLEKELSGERLEGLIALNDSNLARTRSSTSIDKITQDSDNQQNKSASEADTDSDDEMNLMNLKFLESHKLKSSEERAMSYAKEMGRELYMNLHPEERREKLDNMITKLQREIDRESEVRAELARSEREAGKTSKQRSQIRIKIAKCDERIQALALLMLHYCAGLQHCMDQMEDQEQETMSGDVSSMGDVNPIGDVSSTRDPSINDPALQNDETFIGDDGLNDPSDTTFDLSANVSGSAGHLSDGSAIGMNSSSFINEGEKLESRKEQPGTLDSEDSPLHSASV
ncbi:unnamed protein product [Owenia fusiformis]|uniref:Uncharacterized protein n=1 Tax=Owenia fusiformis TaxID=6347 RepID=A0A8J1XME7_OWEFU|nr:unnamed protein product [Owenia fusiformis]